jgi:hypothetical protein
MGREPITVYKLDAQGNEQWRYPATVLERGPGHIRVEAFFNRDDMPLGYVTFKRGDLFIETFFDDRWYNVFAVYDRDDRGLKGWYCNVCRPATITSTVVRCDDLALDVWVTPDGDVTVLDEAEFAALPIPDADRNHARNGLAELLAQAESGRLPR